MKNELFETVIKERMNIGKKDIKDISLGSITCPQYNGIFIDTNCNVVRCCVVSPWEYENNYYKSIFEVKRLSEINDWRNHDGKCNECINLGICYQRHNPIGLDRLFNYR
jgi:hypothetical protein